MEFLKTSIQTCEATHDACFATVQPATPVKMLIIDLDTMSIDAAPAGCRYIALSYVWGRETEKWLTHKRENGINLRQKDVLLQASLPQTIKDAMQICIDLGERYLWVDSLCIVQDDPVSQKQQIDIMDLIYASAEMTIVAAAGDHANSGLPGITRWARTAKRQTITIQGIEISNILPRMVDTAERSVWNTRGWTYQERMFSRRCIFLTDAQAFYVCSEEVCYERKNRLLPTIWNVERLDSKLRWKTSMEFYSHAVQEYTLRSLTSQSDIFRAFQGIMNDMSRRWDQKFFFGLPNKNFEDALLWQEVGQGEKRDANLVLPSWSWATANGAIKHTFKEKRIVDSSPLPAFWLNGQEPEPYCINWLLNEDGTQMSRINETSPVSTSSSTQFPGDLGALSLQQPGRLLFQIQHAFLDLANSVPFVTNDFWWTDYTIDVDLSRRSIASILHNDVTDPIGFIELDRAWAQQSSTQELEPRPWEFLALSLATMDPNDYMHRHFTMRRNIGYPLILSRNVRELIVNVTLVEKNGHLRRRLGVGKVYLDCWELADPKKTWVVLE